MMTRKISWMSVFALCLSVGACDKGDAGSKDAKTAAKSKAGDAKAKAGDAKAKAGDAKAGDTKADGGEAEPAKDVFDDRVVKAAALAEKIEADPSKADDVLEAAGMDRAALDALMYEMSQPELAEQYRLARARQNG